MKKIVSYLIFICTLIFSFNQNIDVSAQEINEMGSFPTVITSVKQEIVKVSFIKDTQTNIDARFEAAPIKANLTSGEGSVKGWLEVSSTDSSKYALFIASEGTIYLTTGSLLFSGWSSLTEINFNNINTSKVTNMNSMFSNCSKLTSLNLSNFDTSKVTSMSSMFFGCSKLTSLDLSNFDTSKVTFMSSMFFGCSNLISINLSSFNTSKVTSMASMFIGCSKLKNLEVSKFDTSNVTSLSQMFYGCSSLTNINLSSFNTSKVTSMSGMFENCKSLTTLDLSNFDTSLVQNMSSMFRDCSNLTSINLSNFNTSLVTNMRMMFLNCSNLTSLNLSNFDTSKVTSMSSMFFGCSKLTSLDLSNFNTSKVTDMSSMFLNCSNLTSLNLSNFNTSNVTDMSSMFYRCSNLTILDLSKFSLDGVTKADKMFGSTSTLKTIYMNQKGIDKLSKFDHGATVGFTLKESGINTLKTLTLSSGKINFNSNTTTYNVTVANDIEKIKISSVLTSSSSTYVSGYGNREVNLKEGLNVVLIKVKADNGNIKTYTLNITREKIVNTLKTLTLSSCKINFNPNTTTYNVIVANDIEKIKISSTLTNSKSTYVSGYGNREVSLEEGLNVVLIKIKAENGNVNTYTLNIRRETKEIIDIKFLNIENYNIDFSTENQEYTLKINNEENLNIEVILTTANATYEILNNNDLKNGSIIVINVLSSDNEIIKEYKINIEKDEVTILPAYDKSTNNGYIGIIVFSTGLICFIGSLIYYLKRK